MATRVVVPLCGVCAVAVLLSWMMRTGPHIGRTGGPIAGSLLLVGAAVLIGWRQQPARVKEVVCTAPWHLAAGAAAVLAAVHLVGTTRPSIHQAAVIVIAAWAEEVVFRRVVPDILRRHWHRSGGRWSAVKVYGLASACFAVSHGAVVTGGSGAPAVAELLRLSAGGMLYGAIALQVGLWGAVGMHAFLNLQVVMAERTDRASLPLVVLAGVVACIAVAVAVQWERQEAATPP